MTEKLHSLYLETTVPIYFVARPSSDVLISSHQRITREWWNAKFSRYRVFVSETVYDEITGGDPVAAKRRLAAIQGIPILEVSKEAGELAKIYIRELPLPNSALTDALHMAIASVNAIDFLVTWNCRHIARGSVKRSLPGINAALGLTCHTNCTPEELLYED
jgi:hypothetical protein